jgi:hypothetical protein
VNFLAETADVIRSGRLFEVSIGLNGKFLRFRRDGVSISYTLIYLSQFDVCLAIT